MPGPFSPGDVIVGPIAEAISCLITTQIPSITHVYPTLVDRPPGDNAVVLRFTRGKVRDETNGKVKVLLTYTMQHIFRRTEVSDALSRSYTYIIPWLQFLAAWPNQQLGGLAIEMSATDLATTPITVSGQPVVALLVDFNVLTEFNISIT